jgi:hypothetical protein
MRIFGNLMKVKTSFNLPALYGVLRVRMDELEAQYLRAISVGDDESERAVMTIATQLDYELCKLAVEMADHEHMDRNG